MPIGHFRPMYPDFPAQVMAAPDLELYVNALAHYWGSFVADVTGQPGYVILPSYPKSERAPLDEAVRLRVIDLGTEGRFRADLHRPGRLQRLALGRRQGGRRLVRRDLRGRPAAAPAPGDPAEGEPRPPGRAPPEAVRADLPPAAPEDGHRRAPGRRRPVRRRRVAGGPDEVPQVLPAGAAVPAAGAGGLRRDHRGHAPLEGLLDPAGRDPPPVRVQGPLPQGPRGVRRRSATTGRLRASTRRSRPA